MLEFLEGFIEHSSPRLIPAWNQYVQNIETFKQPLLKRFLLANDYETSGVALIRYIFSCVDWNYMHHCSNDYQRYLYHLRYVRDDLENTFDHTTTGFKFFNLFTSKHLGKVQEFIIPVEDSTSITNLPFDKGWDEWVKIRPVRYLTHDSPELTLNVEQDKVRFYRTPPTYAIISIDVIALVLKYWKYLTDAPVDPEYVGKDQRRFIHKYVLFGFLDDLIDVFLIQHIKRISEVQDEDELNHFNVRSSSTQMYGYVGARYNEASRVLYREFQKVKSGTTRANMIFSSPLLGHKKSIVDRVNMIVNNLDVPRLRQYQFYRYLRDKDLFNMMMNIFKFRYMDPQYLRLQRVIKPKILRMIRNKIWLYMKDPVIRLQIQDEIEELNEKISWN